MMAQPTSPPDRLGRAVGKNKWQLEPASYLLNRYYINRRLVTGALKGNYAIYCCEKSFYSIKTGDYKNEGRKR